MFSQSLFFVSFLSLTGLLTTVDISPLREVIDVDA